MEAVDSAGPIIKNLLVHQDAEGIPAEDLGEEIYRTLNQFNCGFCKVPGWWMNEETGIWTEFLFLHSAEQTEDAIRITRAGADIVMRKIKRQADKGDKIPHLSEESFEGHLSLLKDSYMPKSVIEYGFHTGDMEYSGWFIKEDGEFRIGKTSEMDILVGPSYKYFFTQDGETTYQKKFKLKAEYSQKEDIKDLDWDKTHRVWDEDEDCWAVDASSVVHTVNDLASKGYAVGLSPEAEQKYKRRAEDAEE